MLLSRLVRENGFSILANFLILCNFFLLPFYSYVAANGSLDGIVDVDGVDRTDITDDFSDFVNKSILFVGDSHMRGLVTSRSSSRVSSYN